VASRQADYDDPRSLENAFRGLDSLIFVSSDGRPEVMARHHENVLEALIEARVRHVVYTSVVTVGEESSFVYNSVHRWTEDALAKTDIEVFIARTSIFFEFFLSSFVFTALDRGELAIPAGDGRMSLVSREDVGDCLATAANEGRVGRADLTGPESLTGTEIAVQVSEVTGRPMIYVSLGGDDYRAELQASGAARWLIDAFSTMFEAIRLGQFAAVSDDVRAMSRHPPLALSAYLTGIVRTVDS
jgi:NAD(P)H dehydrogenase (quinone)